MDKVTTTIDLSRVIPEILPDIKNSHNVKSSDKLKSQSLALIELCDNIKKIGYSVSVDQAEDLADEIFEYSRELEQQVVTVANETTYKYKRETLQRAYNSIKEKITSKKNELEREYILTSLDLAIKSMDRIGNRVNDIESKIETGSLPDFKKKISGAVIEVDHLLNDFQSLASNATSETIYGKFKDNANMEKQASDRFRNYSICAMFSAAAVALFFVVESLYFPSNLTDSGTASLRIFSSLLLSVPAAYFARESSKHRRQQYFYQQYALNLNALNPFIAELEPHEKNALKSEMARKLFTSSHEPGGSNGDPYPINANELLTLLISKIEIRSPASSSNSDKTQ